MSDWKKEFEEKFGWDFREISKIPAHKNLRSWIESFIQTQRQEAKRETLKAIREAFVSVAIRGKDDPDTVKGLYLYARFLEYIDALTSNEKEGI